MYQYHQVITFLLLQTISKIEVDTKEVLQQNDGLETLNHIW